MSQKLPLFPLNTVLFPGAPLSLHIFEERYRLMIGRCLEQNVPFGVVLLRSGSEVSAEDPWVRRMREATDAELPAGEPVPHEVGTSARIAEHQRLDDGRYLLVAIGQRRFRIQYIVQRQPYLIASVGYLPEEPTPSAADSADMLRATFVRYWEALEQATGRRYERDEPPVDALELAYWMAHRLRVDTQRKQRWLESDVATRLREMTRALDTELSLIPASGPAPESEAGPWSWN